MVSLQLEQYGQMGQEKCPIDTKALNKQERGSFDFRHDREDGLIVCAWNDNSVVTLASNSDTVGPLTR